MQNLCLCRGLFSGPISVSTSFVHCKLLTFFSKDWDCSNLNTSFILWSSLWTEMTPLAFMSNYNNNPLACHQTRQKCVWLGLQSIFFSNLSGTRLLFWCYCKLLSVRMSIIKKPSQSEFLNSYISFNLTLD